MNSSSLRQALRVRQASVEAARRRLSQDLAAVAEADHALRAAQHVVREERQVAVSGPMSGMAVQAFAAWLPLALRAAQDGSDRRAAAEAEVIAAREALLAALSAQAVVEAVAARQKALLQKTQRNKEQQSLDDAMAASTGHDRRIRQA